MGPDWDQALISHDPVQCPPINAHMDHLAGMYGAICTGTQSEYKTTCNKTGPLLLIELGQAGSAGTTSARGHTTVVMAMLSSCAHANGYFLTEGILAEGFLDF